MNFTQKITLTAPLIAAYMYSQWARKRLRFEGVAWNGQFTDNEDIEWIEDKGFTQFFDVIRDWHFYGGHGGDEYGNCTLFFRCPLFGVVWWYPTGHYQTEVELPQPGKNKWVDRVHYDGCDERYCTHEDET